MANRKYTYGRTTARERGIIVNHKGTWDEITELFKEPVRRNVTMAQYAAMSPKSRAHNKNTGLFFGGECKGGHRKDNSLVCRSLVNLDLDDHCADIWFEWDTLGCIQALEGFEYLVHSTRSSTAEKPKFRIWLTLKREVTPAEYEPVARYIAELLDESMMAVARESYTPAQGMYLPSVSQDQEYHFGTVAGKPFDPDIALDKYPADDASKWPKRSKEQCTEYVPGRTMTHPEDKKIQAPIICAAHRVFHPCDFIEEFLSDVYLPSGERYYIQGATGAPSVRVYDDAYVQSDHGSDPAVGQHNVFDLGRIHLFGGLDDDFETDNISPAEWPSYKAMVEFLMERDDIKEAMVEIEAEIEAARNSNMLDMLAGLDDDDDLDDDDEEDDLIGAEADEDDLIGDVAPKPKKAKTIEDVLRKIKISISKAKSLDDLERRLEIIRGFPTTDFRELHRDLVAPELQKKFKELTDESITKATARRMLEPTVENLRKQYEDEDLPDWIKDWVYVTMENKFLNLDTKQLLARDGFNGLLAVECGDEFGRSNLGISKIAPADAALSVYAVPKPYALKFHPDRPVLFDEDGVLFANTYRRASVSSGDYKGRDGVKLLKRLVEDLFPVPRHQHLLMDFLAHCVKNPGQKLLYALLVKGAENEGKSLFAELVRQLIGQSNYSSITNKQLGEKFNGWAHEKLFCTIEEIKMPGREAYEVLNTIKPVITNPMVPIRKMQKDTILEPNYCNLYLTTNFEDCLPLEEDNTRFCVLFTRFRTNQEVKDWHAQLKEDEGEVYTKVLWEHIQKRPGQFIEFFAKYEFSANFDPTGRAPDTVFKATMAEDSKSEERTLLEQILAAGEHPTISDDVLIWADFREILDARGLGPKLHNKAIASFLKPLGFVNAKHTTYRDADGAVQNLRVWTRNLEMLGGEGRNELTKEGRETVVAAVTQTMTMTEDELDEADLKSRVVPFKRK